MDTTPRDSGISSIGKAPWSTHFCQFYHTRDDLLDVLVPYLKTGLANNEFCVWVTSDPIDVKTATEAMGAVVPGFDEILEKGQIEIFPHTEWYMKDGYFDFNRVLGGWVEKYERAVAAGYDGIRVTGNTAWLEKKDWQAFTEYENMIEQVISDYRMLVLCTYSLDRCGANEIIDVVANHEFALIERDGEWEMIESARRQQAIVATRESAAELTAIYDNAPLIMLLVDGDLRIRKTNRFAEQFAGLDAGSMFGLRPGSALGCLHSQDDEQGCGFGPHCQDCPVRGQILDTMETGRGHHQVELSRPFIVGGRARNVPFLLSTAKLDINTEPRVLMTIQDISERKKAEEKIRSSLLQFEMLAETAEELLKSDNPQEIVDTLCAKVMSFLDCHAFFNYLAGPKAGRLHLNAYAGIPEEAAKETEWLDYGVAVCGCAARDGERIICENIPETDDPRTDLVESYGIKAYACHPLLAGTKVIGTLSFGTRSRTSFKDDEIALMKAVADQVAVAMERMQTQEDLKEARDYLENLFNYANAPIIVWDSLLRITRFNHAFERLTGYDADEVTGRELRLLFDEGTRDQSLAEIARTLSGELWESVEIPIRRKDGAVRLVLWNSANIYGDDGSFLATIAQGQDITERKEAEEALRQSEALARALQDANPETALLLDTAANILRANEVAAARLGGSPDELAGRNFYDLIPSDVAARRREHIEEALRTGKPVRAEDGRDGMIFDNAYYPLFDARGRAVSLAYYARDITGQRQLEESLRETRDYLESLLNHANAPIIVWDPAYRITQFNRAFERLTGYAAGGVIGQKLEMLFPEASREESLAEIVRTLQGEFWDSVEIPILCQDGEVRVVLWNSANVYAADGRTLVATIAQGQDITARKQAESELIETMSKLEMSNNELQQFAYIASHDLQEPLRMVASFLQLLWRRYGENLDGEAREFIDYAVDGANRMQLMINDLLQYSRVGTPGKEFEPADVEAVFEKILENLRVAIEDSGAVVTHGQLPVITADSTQISQLMQNLISNAIKFRGEQPPRVHVQAERRDSEWLFSVSDNGIGIEPEFADRIFVIFQRLHGRTEYPGTGIGLAVCKRIVGRHGGRLWVESEPSRGATFKFTIPDNQPAETREAGSV